MRKHQHKTLYACIVRNYNGIPVRSSFFGDLSQAIDSAMNRMGIIAIEKIDDLQPNNPNNGNWDGKGQFVWYRTE